MILKKQSYMQIFVKEAMSQSRFLFPTVLKLYALPILFMAALIPSLYSESGYDFIEHIMRDPAAITNPPAYTGLVSNIGVLLWTSCAALCLFTASMLKRQTVNVYWVSFLVYAGLLTAFLCLDDFFMFHDRIIPDFFNLSEKYLFAVYGIVTGDFLIRHRKLILKTEYLFLMLALIFFGLSLFIDTYIGTYKGSLLGSYLFEDGFKFLGILSWFFYFLRVCSHVIAGADRGQSLNYEF